MDAVNHGMEGVRSRPSAPNQRPADPDPYRVLASAIPRRRKTIEWEEDSAPPGYRILASEGFPLYAHQERLLQNNWLQFVPEVPLSAL
eukprot:8182427-Pyramimonas_sp.AAC.1